MASNILIVDDNPENLWILMQMLQNRDYHIRPVSDGMHVLADVVKEPPDLILLDIIMPGMDGFEVCRQLKTNNLTREIPIIFISALNETIDKVKAFELGGVDYITKPFQTKEVLARVDTHLKLLRLQQELRQKNEALHAANESLEDKVQARTAELAQANRSLHTEIEQRIQHQQEKDRLFEVVSQQSEQLRNLTTWLIESQNKERQGLASGLRQEIEQNIELLQSNLHLVQTLLTAQPADPVINHLKNAAQILQTMRQYVGQVTTNLDETTAKEQTLSQDPFLKLSSRERQVLCLLTEGKTNVEIAAILTVAPSTIHTYTSRIKQKLEIDNLPGLTKFAIDHNLLE